MKPYIWHDEKIGSVSREARLLFVGLITLADDDGRFRTLAPAICGHVFPYDADAPRKLSKWMDELTGAGLVDVYGDHFGVLPRWSDHQKISHPTPSILPEPILNGSRAAHE